MHRGGIGVVLRRLQRTEAGCGSRLGSSQRRNWHAQHPYTPCRYQPFSSSGYHNSSRGASAGSSVLPSQAQVVVCGGGNVGCSVAYHLPKVGFKDVLLLEQGSLGCGTSWHAASLVSIMRSSLPHTKLCKYGAELYARLEEETGLATGWKQCGGLIVARNKERLNTLHRLHSISRIAGVETELIAPSEIKQLPGCSIVRTDDLLAALWIPGEGVVTSSDLYMSLARGAKQQGVQIVENVCVEGVEVEQGRVCGVRTDKGTIRCEIFVNTAGQWARQLGQLSDPPVSVPLHSLDHCYVITKPFDGVHSMMPTVKDFCGYIYSREWSGGILIGGFLAKSCFQNGVPKPFEFQLLPEDWDLFVPLMDQILHRFPTFKEAEIRQFVNGPDSFTPDSHYLVGETPEVSNYYVAAGMSGSGIAAGAGVGKAVSEWIAGGGPPSDLWCVDVSRFSRHHNQARFLEARTVEAVGNLCQLHYPGFEMSQGRGVRTSPLHSRLEKAGARWGEVMAWERPNWFTQSENDPYENQTFDKPVWFESVAVEHAACRERAALFDLSSFAKFEIQGPDAEAAMQKLCCNNMAVPPGKIVYTGMLNNSGGYVTDCIITRLAQDRFFATCPAGQVTHDAAWISRHLPPSTSLSDVTERYAVLALMGPRSRDILQSITRAPLDNEHFPFATAQVM